MDYDIIFVFTMEEYFTQGMIVNYACTSIPFKLIEVENTKETAPTHEECCNPH